MDTLDLKTISDYLSAVFLRGFCKVILRGFKGVCGDFSLVCICFFYVFFWGRICFIGKTGTLISRLDPECKSRFGWGEVSGGEELESPHSIFAELRKTHFGCGVYIWNPHQSLRRALAKSVGISWVPVKSFRSLSSPWGECWNPNEDEDLRILKWGF